MLIDAHSRVKMISSNAGPHTHLVKGKDPVSFAVQDAAGRPQRVDALAGHPFELLVEGLDLFWV